MFFKKRNRDRATPTPDAKGEKKAAENAEKMGDGVPRTYSSETAAGKEKTSFGGAQGGD